MDRFAGIFKALGNIKTDDPKSLEMTKCVFALAVEMHNMQVEIERLERMIDRLSDEVYSAED